MMGIPVVTWWRWCGAVTVSAHPAPRRPELKDALALIGDQAMRLSRLTADLTELVEVVGERILALGGDVSVVCRGRCARSRPSLATVTSSLWRRSASWATPWSTDVPPSRDGSW